MSYPRVIRNFMAYKNGIGYMGLVSVGKLPEVKLKTESHRGAGMDGEAAIDMGTEALKTELTFDEYVTEVIKSWGTNDRIVLRPAAQARTDAPDQAAAFIFTMGALTSSLEFDELKAGENSKMKVTGEVDFLKIEKDGEELIKIDIENDQRVVGGVDQLAGIRRAMGL